ncbi:hypothetical protein GOODEAATRI_030304, partial [Goodea atripinnis]
LFPVAVCPDLPIDGVAVLMGNDIPGGLGLPSLVELEEPSPIWEKVSIPLTNICHLPNKLMKHYKNV